jgi:S-layer homology domain
MVARASVIGRFNAPGLDGRNSRMASTQSRLPRRVRRGAAALIVGLAILLPASALAVISPFGDVDGTNPFYTNILNMANSGITSGCGGGNFCPKDPITREQMAAFLNRAAPRATSKNFSTPLGNTPGGKAADGGTVASLTVTSLKNEYLFLTTAFFTITYPGGVVTLPCENGYRFQVDGSDVGLASMYDRVTSAPPASWATTTISGQTMVSVGAGSHTVKLVYVDGPGSCSNYPGSGSLTAMVIPFAGNMTSIP